jgi:hypothetical protein
MRAPGDVRVDETTGRGTIAQQIAPFMSEIIDAGGLVEWTRRRLHATGRA